MALVLVRGGAQRQRAGWRGILYLPLLLASLTGCESLINPYIDADPITFPYAKDDPFPELRKAAMSAEGLRKKALDYRNEQVVTRSWLGFAIFGAAAAGGVAALYGASRDLVLGLGLGAGGGYTFGELYLGTDKIGIYSAAGRSLYCVVAAADSVSATGKSLTELTAAPSGEKDPDGEKDPGGSYWQQDDKLAKLLGLPWNEEVYKRVEGARQAVKEARQARHEYAAAFANFKTFTQLDFNFASAAGQAAAMILEAMEQRLSAIQPNLDAVLRAAEGIGSLGVAYAKRVTPPKKRKGEEVAKRELGEAEVVELALFTTQVKQAAAKINERVIGATNRMGQIGTACVLKQPTAAKLTISQTSVTLGQGQTVTLVARGGKLPLTRTWKGAGPSSKQIEVTQSSGREIFLFGKAGFSAGEFTLLIRDSLASPGEVEIKISAAVAKLTAKPEEVTVKIDGSEPASIAVSGGTSSYQARWIVGGQDKPKITIEVAGGTITLTRQDGLKVGEHSLLVSDSATPPQTVIVKVKAVE